MVKRDNKRQWINGCLMLVVITVLVLLLFPFSLNHPGRVWKAWWDAAHVPAMAAITFSLLVIFPGRRKWWLLPAVLVLVPLIEYAQGFTGREQSMTDVWYGWTGGLLGGCLFAGIMASLPGRFVFVMAAAMLVAGASVYPLRLWREDRRVEHLYPVLSKFDSELEKTRWTINGCDVDSRADGWEITIRKDAEYPGLFLRDQVNDWSGMAGIALDIFLAGDQQMEMWVRMDDLPDDPSYFNRFQKPVTLRPGFNRVVLDRKAMGFAAGGRSLDLHHIHAFGIFFHRRNAGQVIRLTRLELLTGPG